ncbi:MAG: M1 family metallopeptidase [Planctomycetaceae bacterium]|nr:M1 family metallopeptidase [Planctomycetaceae bacterium]
MSDCLRAKLSETRPAFPTATGRLLALALWLLANEWVLVASAAPSGVPRQDVEQSDEPRPRISARQERAQRMAVLRGEYGRFRANNDLLYYHLDIRIDPAAKTIQGRTQVRFKMLVEDQRIQLDLYANLNVDRIVWREQELKFEREFNAVFVDFPEVLKPGEVHEIDFHYSGSPQTTGRFGGFTFGQDPQGRPWIYTACQGEGASIWWPNKDQLRDEVEAMDISIEVPSDLKNISNGRFLGSDDLGDGYSRWRYHVSYPINNYCVSVNIGHYEQFGEKLGDLTLDYYVLPEDLEKARFQFAQVRPMMEAFVHYFGEYPFQRDGYKLIQVPYTGMEHQSAVTYGNGFQNGYGGRDWTGVGVSPKFDFIIIHETGHEWFGNAVSCADVADMWIQEGWTTYLECMYVEHVFGYEDALKYTNGYRSKIANRQPIITQRGLHQEPSQDMYFKGALFLHTLRGVRNDDAAWWALVREIYDRYKYRNILSEDLISLFSERYGRDMQPIFDQYLRHAKIPTLELAAGNQGELRYRWKADVPGFQMPIRAGEVNRWQVLEPTTEWQTLVWDRPAGEFAVATELYYVDVVWADEPSSKSAD